MADLLMYCAATVVVGITGILVVGFLVGAYILIRIALDL